eukprot:scaffold670292_cov47-Prasinocladus_malaysianus.AAC.1
MPLLAKLGLVAGLSASAAGAYYVWQQNGGTRVEHLILDAAHVAYLEEQAAADRATLGMAFTKCVGHAKAADAEDVFNTARCAGGKKQK